MSKPTSNLRGGVFGSNFMCHAAPRCSARASRRSGNPGIFQTSRRRATRCRGCGTSRTREEVLRVDAAESRRASRCRHAACRRRAPLTARNGLLARHAPVADFQRQVVEQPREAELVPLHPVVDRDEVVVDVGIVVEAGARAAASAAKPWPAATARVSSGSHGSSSRGTQR